MPDVKVSRITDLASDQGDLQITSAKPGVTLAATQYLAKAAPGPANYLALVDACCKASEPLASALFAKGFRPWILLVGAKRSAEMKRRLPNYTLAGPLQEQHLIGAAVMEHVFPLAEVERTAGLYLVDQGKFCEACRFMTQNSWSIVILSRRDEFLSSENLALVYNTGAFDGSGKPITQLNWSALSAAVCPWGDIVVKTIGAFDDRDRSVNFVFAAGNSMIPAPSTA